MHCWIQTVPGRWELRADGEACAVIQRDVTLWRWVVGDSCGVARDLQAAMLTASWIGGFGLPEELKPFEPLQIKKTA